MPEAHAADVKRWLQDHDTDLVSETPPVQNQWYTVFDAEDVRLTWCHFIQTNDEVAAKNIEVRWTVDGTVYFVLQLATNNTGYFVYRWVMGSAVGTAGLATDTATRNAVYFVDKRGLSFKVEIRITSPLGTNQTLACRCTRETLEQT